MNSLLAKIASKDCAGQLPDVLLESSISLFCTTTLIS